VHYTGSGGDEKRIVRAGTQAWVWYPFGAKWVDAEEYAMPGAGTGIQNPDALLELLGARAGDARFGKSETVLLSLPGPAFRNLLKDQLQLQDADWAKSSAEVQVRMDEKGRIQNLTVSAQVAEAAFEGTLVLGALGTAAPLGFLDEERKPIPFPEGARQANEAKR
jgi:hypothetical protein